MNLLLGWLGFFEGAGVTGGVLVASDIWSTDPGEECQLDWCSCFVQKFGRFFCLFSPGLCQGFGAGLREDLGVETHSFFQVEAGKKGGSYLRLVMCFFVFF